jgi:hypothetical protein
VWYSFFMSVRDHGGVEDGRSRVDTPVDLPDNTGVEPVTDLSETDDERELREAIAQSDVEIARGEEIPFEDVLAELRAARTGCRATG